MHTNPSSASSSALTSAPHVDMNVSRMAIVAALSLLVSGCGLKGPLHMPEKSTPVVITPGTQSSSSSSSSSSATP